MMNAEAKRARMPCFEIGIGLNTGTVIAGTLGGRGRLDYTVLGDAVNVAQRRQSEAGPGEILAAAATVRRAREPDAQLLGPKRLKGRREPVETYQVCWNAHPRERTSPSPGRTPPAPLPDPAAS